MMERRSFFKTILAAFATVPLVKASVQKLRQPRPANLSRERDDAPRIQAMIDDAAKNGETFVLPPGTYYLRSSIYLGKSPFIIRGSTFHASSCDFCLNMDGDPEVLSGSAVMDCIFHTGGISAPGWSA